MISKPLCNISIWSCQLCKLCRPQYVRNNLHHLPAGCRKTCMIWLHNCKGCVTFLQQTHFINVNNKISSRQSIEKEEDAFLKAAISQVSIFYKNYSTYNVLCQQCVDVPKFYRKKSYRQIAISQVFSTKTTVHTMYFVNFVLMYQSFIKKLEHNTITYFIQVL